MTIPVFASLALNDAITGTTTVPVAGVWGVGLVVVAAAIGVGRQWQRLDSMEKQIKELRGDVRELLRLFAPTPVPGR